MRNRLLIVAGAFLLTGLLVPPARGWQVSTEDHAKHHPEAQTAPSQAAPPANPESKRPAGMAMMAPDAKLDELVKKMNAAQGQAKVDAMAELLTVLVQTHQTMHASMSHMMQNMPATHGK